MKAYRLWLAGAAALAVLAAAGYGFVTGLSGLNEIWEVESALDARDSEMRRAEELTAQRKALNGRLQARRKVLQEVVDQRLTLLQAAAQLRDLDDGAQAEMARRVLRYYFTGNSDEERYCRMVITLARELVREQSRSSETEQRLQDELDEYLRR